MTENVTAAPTATKPKRQTWGGRGLTVAIAVAAVITVAGIACWAVQLSGGMVQTGMRNLDSWGLYITMFMFFGQRATNHNSVTYADAEIIVG